MKAIACPENINRAQLLFRRRFQTLCQVWREREGASVGQLDNDAPVLPVVSHRGCARLCLLRDAPALDSCSKFGVCQQPYCLYFLWSGCSTLIWRLGTDGADGDSRRPPRTASTLASG